MYTGVRWTQWEGATLDFFCDLISLCLGTPRWQALINLSTNLSILSLQSYSNEKIHIFRSSSVLFHTASPPTPLPRSQKEIFFLESKISTQSSSWTSLLCSNIKFSVSAFKWIQISSITKMDSLWNPFPSHDHLFVALKAFISRELI